MATKETLTALEVNVLTGEETIRELTAEEIAELETMALEQAAAQADREAAEAARQASIRKMAEASGLTNEEIEALFL